MQACVIYFERKLSLIQCREKEIFLQMAEIRDRRKALYLLGRFGEQLHAAVKFTIAKRSSFVITVHPEGRGLLPGQASGKNMTSSAVRLWGSQMYSISLIICE